jgi:hypothetical protein
VHQVGYNKLIDIMMHGQRNIKTDGRIVHKQVLLNEKLKTGKRGQKRS